MNKKNRVPFSALSIDEKEERVEKEKRRHMKKPKNAPQKKKKGSTYQYTKKSYHKPRSNSGIKRNQKEVVPPPAAGVIRIVPLGGVEEIGKNMTAIEIDDDIIVIDAGMYFSNEATPGIDYVIPNTTYLEERKDKIKALFITHGHLDHIGGAPLVLSRIGNPPVYSRNLSILLMRKRHAEFPQLPKMKEHIVEEDSVVTVGKIKVRFFGVTHTIPDSMGVIVETEHGWIVTPGDYKLDHIDGKATKEEEKEYSIFENNKSLLLMTDSTNIENEGFSLPEAKVLEGLENLLKKINGRIIVAAFASHITRLAHIIKISEKLGKKVAVDGRSMKTNIEVAIEAEYLKAKKSTLVPIEEADDYPPDKVVILMTGAQGEEYAALNRAAKGTHRKFSLHKNDTVILSASVVPGNERQVEKMKDGLARQGVHIISYRTAGEDFVHATGHGNKEDIKWLHQKIKPKFFIPIHGNHYRLVMHKELAMEVGMSEENIVVPDNGSIIEISADGKKINKRKERAPGDPMIVDGTSVGDDQQVVIRDRVMLAQDGMFVIIVVIDQRTGKIRKSPDLISRGFVYLKENQDLLKQARNIIRKVVDKKATNKSQVDLDAIKAELGENVSKFLYQKTSKRPLVIPVVINV